MSIYKDSFDFETSVKYLIEQSNKKAWLIAIVSVFITLLSILAVLVLTPLKTVEPYVIRVDNTTGMVDILTTLDEKQITQNEALDKHFIGQYIKAREGYFFDMLNQDYIFTQLLSSPEVAESYRAIYSGENSRDSRLGSFTKVEVNILSVVLGESNGIKTATARINLKSTNKNSKEESLSTKVITLSYKYLLNEMQEKNRILNPLGFKVLTYRIDEEISK
ncbi:MULTISPECIES: virB8 family protein [Campylobacter]|uniref:Type IV secretion system protein n=2 Tax=Campylobacter TaxID=194 RepID=A0AAX2UL99_9BACT|nr:MULTISPECIES: type IV secretion system protein [Campylobacter]EEY3085996.1 type IV secretion system protein [Campylobacter jejuni]ARE81489.1 type IV secretion system protein VirB8 [Campylobacter helveticus]EAH5199931.1 type IV secretion system protein [Campylobacter upsaliensis]EAI3917891.1 type IV secretion system protein [Campylobacter upsaliensis]EAI4345262.1 type IV secretion system protein [Campylobacter upsaliensis]